MIFSLSSQNIFEYLVKHKLCVQEEQSLSQVELKVAKNFNLLVNLSNNKKLLVKQERQNSEGKTAGEFFKEWQIQEFIRRFPKLDRILSLLPEVVHFDPENSIIVFNYLNDYGDLSEFYTKENIFPTAMATSIGNTIATIHRATFNHQEYREFFSQNSQDESLQQTSKISQGLERISPEVFGLVPADGIKFFALYQKYDSFQSTCV